MASLFKNKIKYKGKTITYPNWYGCYQDEDGKWQKVKLYTDKDASWSRLQEIQRRSDRRRAGVLTKPMEEAPRPLSEHVADYIASLEQANYDAEHRRIAKWMLEQLVKLGAWTQVADITADSMRRILAKLAHAKKTVAYQNKYITRAKAFINWLIRENRVDYNPLVALKRGKLKGARKTRARRPLEDAAVEGLLTKPRVNRRLAYAFGCLAGLRRSELAGLTWGDLRLDAEVPFIQLRADLTKNDKADALPLHPYILALLKLVPNPEDAQRRIVIPPDMKTMVKDLKSVGFDLADERGLRRDFHALRHTLATNLSRTGCSETNKKAIMRHADESVTDGYSHARLAELAEAIKRLPAPTVS